jgi:peptidoglycan/xylan/chitin deacetylase (PgdA/CDA1 family)
MWLARRLEAFLLTIGLAGVVLVAPITASAQSQTVVSVTFDDGWANQYETVSTLAAHGMKGTYYVNTGRTGTSGFLSWDQLVALDAAGHEVTGHTLDHVDLVAAAATEVRRQVCDDRQNLVARGFVATSFAYPFGEYNATVKSIVQECGYASGRGAFGLRNITSTTDTRPFASRIPPPDRYAILTPCCIRSDVTLTQLQNYIIGAENNGGGWVPLVLHRICENCGGDSPAPSMTPATFQALVDWLAQRSGRGTVVRTVAQVMSGDAQPATSSARCDSTTCASGWYAGPVSVSLQTTDGGSGVAAVRYTLDGSEPTVSSQLYTGPFTVSQTTTVKFRSWDNGNNVEPTMSQLIQIDATAPASSISCNGSPCVGTAYDGPVTVALAAADDASGVDAIRYTLDGSDPTETSPLYGEPFTVSETTTVRFRAWDTAGNVEAVRSQLVEVAPPPPQDTTAPTSAIACNGSACSTGWYTGPVSVALSATDDASGVAEIRYTLDGSEPTVSSQLYTGPFTVSQTTTAKFRAWDNAGNVELANSRLVQIDATAPTVAIAAPQPGTTVRGVVKVTATAADVGSGALGVSFYANGVLIGSKAGGGTVFVNWNTTKLRGQYTLTAVATDVAGNSTTSAPVTVTVR